MVLRETAGKMAERLPVPDVLTRLGIGAMVGRTRRQLATAPQTAERDFARAMQDAPIARNTADANAQHYELPPAFFAQCLGPRRKYSCCYYPTGAETLAQAEVAALTETLAHAQLADGQDILELGCGWGSLSLFMAERLPRARITAVSNSAPQRETIEAIAKARGLTNLRVITADMNDFAADATYDRIVSVEMFEHMANWPALLTRLRGWLNPDGRVFLHVFSHRAVPYAFDTGDRTDWIAQYFFTGGIMPSHGLLRHVTDLFTIEQEWRWNGRHYQRTALDWLALFDRNADTIRPILREVYGEATALWFRRWRIFFLATAGLFGDNKGEEWGVSHYLLR
jgi:cyclopropane-fatty-acyl-phospholipid synthase